MPNFSFLLFLCGATFSFQTNLSSLQNDVAGLLSTLILTVMTASVRNVSKVSFEKMKDPGNQLGNCVKSLTFDAHSVSFFL